MKNLFITLFLLVASFWTIRGQQDAQYTQYMYNTVAVNPAYAGSRGVLSIAALHRSQWVGLDGAPTTQTLNINSPISDRVGLGLSIVNDEIGNGTNQDTYFDAVFSYTVPTSEEGKLSFGLKAGGHFLNIDFNRLRNYDPSNAAVGQTNIDNKFSPNFGAGVYYHTEQFYAGLSIPNFLETEHFDSGGNSNSYIAQERMNWYLITGYVFDINPDLKLKPALLFKAVEGAPLQADLSATVLLNDTFSLGAAYRWDAAMSALVGFQLNEKLMLGLAYDREITELGSTSFNDGSFEIFLRFEFLTRYKNILAPRFF
ncbi:MULTISPECIES: PorP/SprF family type IX secretion system membrane protein [Maribacter]|uniref:Type IX secretion system membrane protein, PorP/SprF family n=1 Tax=Maribacter dokdonensis TaxID=320912 RepID=A0ABY0UK84_9FLAO|nr:MULTISPECIES: type IX secretion system membrane protein PorP/SprF [Maribacter]HAF77937.1 type IX secretion system membrane protein PorP/SprF [Maribacter sp.]KSA14465.1 putative membrane protein [Maribacter dokdonensis DSW-8]MDP2526849.1 type IX secretion system membrane protein PorP/SprF [Maribacter dokdonensis]PHN93804.1 type IX secretion system membrane protein PorP/SprF [Maribacter sp. 6B07]CAG2532377.1 PorP/SprF family [Maribacter dokdonensis]|tara:strand:+ start:97371 stop:98309 length:939 start_codon:yes stop_codon:yes gene_type:complete